MSVSERIKLNVGGTIFETTKETLVSAGYFRALFGRWSASSSEHFIDRSPKLFEHVLNLLRDTNYPYPQKYLPELEYYGIDYQAEIIEDRTEKRLDELEKKMEQVVVMFPKLSKVKKCDIPSCYNDSGKHRYCDRCRSCEESGLWFKRGELVQHSGKVYYFQSWGNSCFLCPDIDMLSAQSVDRSTIQRPTPEEIEQFLKEKKN